MLTVFTCVTTTGQLLFECSRYDMVVGPSFNFGVVGLLFYEIFCALCVSGGKIDKYLDYAIYSVYCLFHQVSLLRYRFSLVKGIVHQF